jgi:ParB-like chromosome segregation protein Spo0J
MAKLTAPEKKSALPEAVRFGIRLTAVQQITTAKLSVNPLNAEFFTEETPEYFAKLENDIRKRGILVPLVAKRDGTLLTGHNRLEVALRLGLQYVPVQFVDENEECKLSDEEEREYIVKDNLLRRQISGDEWIQTYRKLYPNFDESVMQASRTSLNAAQIAADTGQSKAAVQKQLQKFRREKTDEPKVERLHFGAKELRQAIERAVCELELNHKKEALEILKEVL